MKITTTASDSGVAAAPDEDQGPGIAHSVNQGIGNHAEKPPDSPPL